MLRSLVEFSVFVQLLAISTRAINLGTITRERRNVNVYLTFHPKGLLGCVKECLLRPRCKGISHHYGSQFCQLAYDTSLRYDSKGFISSPINSWETSIAGICSDHGCKLEETCDTTTGTCSVKDCGPLPDNVDPSAYVLHASDHHVIGSGVAYRCNGYMYNMTGMVASNIFIIRCTENGQWQAANFFCKYRKNDLEKFCPSDHQYEDTTGTCYKTHQDPKTRDEAEQYCASQNKHLLNADVPAKRWAATWQQFIFPESVGQVLLDGRHDGNGWYNWAGQVLSYKEKLDPSPQPGSDCVLLTLDNFSLEAVSCSKIFNFSCHFELCPETAGYSLSNYDVCYKMRPERQFDEVVCMENVTRPELREFYNSSMMEYNYFKGVNFLQNKNDYQYRNLFPIHGKYAFYYENVTASYWAAHERTCRTKGLVVGNMATEGKKRRFLHILGDRASTVLVATKLDTSTYQWAPKEGLDIDLTLTPTTDNSQRDTYVNKCVRLDARNRNYRLKPINCETTLMYLCAEMIGTDAHDLQLFTTVSSYNKAQEQCQNAGKTLVQIYSKSLNSVLDFLIKENVSTHTWIYVYTGHYLVKRDYVYRHMTAPVGTVKEQALNFRSNYTNDTKDANQQVIYYTDTDSFDLAKFNVENFHFVCQTSQLAMWQSPGPDDDTAYIAVRHKQTYTPVVSRKNTLPYACSIDTNSLIRSLVLPRM